MKICPVCEKGILTQSYETTELTFFGITKPVKSFYHKCNSCDSDIALSEDLKLNKYFAEEFKSSVYNNYDPIRGNNNE